MSYFSFLHFIISRFPLSIRSHSSHPPVRLISLSHVPPPLLLYYHKNISVCLCNLFFHSFSFFIFCVPFFSHFFCCYFVITSTDQEKKNVTTESKKADRTVPLPQNEVEKIKERESVDSSSFFAGPPFYHRYSMDGRFTTFGPATVVARVFFISAKSRLFYSILFYHLFFFLFFPFYT